MISSVIGFIYSPKDDQSLNQNSINYNGLEFQLTNDNRYFVVINGNNVIFDNNPNDLQEINIPEFQITQDKTYLIFNPDEKDSNLEYIIAKLYYALQAKGIRAVLACSKEENCPNELPIKTCDNESFYLKKANLTKAYKDNKCLVLEGDNININKYVDKIDLKLIGA